MLQFACRCGNILHFNNTVCGRCGEDVGFDPSILYMVPRRPHSVNQTLIYCDNIAWGACNWLRGSGEGNGLCMACQLNRVIPALSDPFNLSAWSKLEQAKKHLLYQLLRLRLPVDATETGPALRFDFVSNVPTGHLEGVITVNLSEADSVERERQRDLFGEAHRTLLGHMRHESGHYYWMRLIVHGPHLDEFRHLFGDERQDYAASVSRHHREGALPNWHQKHVSAYASAHPWEDWAETWAHYLHMTEALDTAHAMGVKLDGAPSGSFDAYAKASFEELLERWVPLTIVLNSLNRSLGLDDFYPFVLSLEAQRKMEFVHRVVRARWRRLPTFGRSLPEPVDGPDRL